MIVSRCPVRISIAGGSTDLDCFIQQHGRGAVVSFSANIYTYITVFRDTFGQNNIGENYNIVWSRTENVKHRHKIKNDIARVATEYFDSKPLHCWFTADVSSSGSGLASSSSHMVALTAALNELESANLTKSQIIKKSWQLEKNFNPLTGFQDPYGCATGGLNYHELKVNENVRTEPLDASMFSNFRMWLLPTNFNRSSTVVLNTIKKTINPRLLDMADDMYQAISLQDSQAMLEIVKEGWLLKKSSSGLILGNNDLVTCDNLLESKDYVLAHRLIGAGNGGYFLIFTNKDTEKSVIEKDLGKTVLSVSIDYNGIKTQRM